MPKTITVKMPLDAVLKIMADPTDFKLHAKEYGFDLTPCLPNIYRVWHQPLSDDRQPRESTHMADVICVNSLRAIGLATKGSKASKGCHYVADEIPLDCIVKSKLITDL